MLNQINRLLDKPDLGKLILRLSFALMMLLHGWHKLHGGIDFIQGMLVQHGLPAFVGYGVFVGEIVAPVLMILGILTRLSALVFSLTMLSAWLLMGPGSALTLTQVGAWGVENMAVFFFAGIAIALLGSGRYSVVGHSAWR
ncbi:DoxX family protein [Affinibrenneria salicis]|uniref:DoxX family protein n=1 Tax=Affinibrenneria salicis TaxID=2590031 RepID=A0A5J5FYF0_9GAMM|nr:DoxX family protein [Affinibrenneria salicis]KAA8998917.1 DoxX family protein [Affinibrenneria salicis]